MVLFAENHGKCIATSCPSSDNLSKAENTLKTKDRKRRFPCTKAENILIKSRLQESMEIGNEHDKLSWQAKRCASVTRRRYWRCNTAELNPSAMVYVFQ